MANTTLAKYFGVTAPELPKFIVANTFLTNFFDENESVELNYNELKAFLICEEQNEDVKKILADSFDKYLNEYLGNALLKKTKTKNIFLPITKNMIFGYKSNLRNLLYHLLKKAKDFSEADFKNRLNCFLWNDGKDAQGNAFILSKLLSKKEVKTKTKSSDKDNNFGKQKNEEYFENLGATLLKDLNLIFDSKYFNTLDFYRKYDYFSSALTLYVTLFTAYRGNSGEPPALLCKGSSQSSLNYGGFHRSCVAVHNRIRIGYSALLKEYYLNQFNTEDSTAKTLTLYLDENDVDKVMVWFGNRNNKKPFHEFVNDDVYDLSKGTGKQKQGKLKKIEELKEYFGLAKKEARLTKEEFAFMYAEFHKSRRGSNIIKITSVFSSSGAAIGLIHPKGAGKAKYFALSGEIAEFFIRMYISEINKDKTDDTFKYGYLNGFVSWLKDKYHLYIEDDTSLREFLKKDNISINSSDYNTNKRCLIENLTAINCLIKLSDSAYIVTLPEKKGDFKGL